MTQRRVLFYVQHLLGIGHLKRAATIARALAAQDLGVTIVSGGHDIPGLNLGDAHLVQLPSTRATDLYFKELVDADDRPIDVDWKQRRADALFDAYRAADAHVLMFELFPFGRRQMRFEIEPVLQDAITSSRRPVIVSSVRDILVAQAKPERNDEMLGRVARYFDHVLIHGDQRLIPFDRTFPLADRIQDKLHYTGYVVDRTGRGAINTGQGRDEVIVSAGGGAVGADLLKVAIAARPLTALAAHTWRILVGVTVDQPTFDGIAALAGPGIIVERARADFTALVTNSALSISQGGYNTVMEVLEAGTRAVIVPYAGGAETEQTLRAHELARRTPIQVVAENALAAQTLAHAVDAAWRREPPANAMIDTNGAEVSAALIAGWARSAPWS
ncbi:MAG: glycosyltransferase [Proteobacteria bacterium]|nr:glycosyltransferase [Pseudomonadota bacterium]MDA1057881.1 glycosyltransferase [Pseudomonadota bacterium]